MTSSFSMPDFNPIWRREMRQRWRDQRAFFLLLMLSALVSPLVVWQYAQTQLLQPQLAIPNVFRGSQSLGLFGVIGIIFALLLAPALSAPSIASEREAGLLEGLQTSHLKPSEIIIGKLLSSLSFILLLTLTMLPFYAVWMFYGGIAPLAVLGVLATQWMAAITSACVGLFCSAWSRRSNVAMRSTYGLLFFWIIGSLNAWSIVTRGSLFIVRIPVTAASFQETPFTLFGLTNPLIAASLTWFPQQSTWSSVPWLETRPILAWNILFQIVVSVVLLLASASAVQKPFAETYWIEQKKKKAKTEIKEATPSLQEEVEQGWWEIPISTLLRFNNPILAREFRGKFRMHQVPMVAILIEALLGAIVLFYYLRTLWSAMTDPPSRPFIWWGLTFFGLLVLLMATAIMGASAFSRERENGTWEGIQLALLRPSEIIMGKAGASLWACLVFSLPFWPIIVPTLLPARGAVRNVGWDDVATTGLLIFATAWCYGAWGMLLSWWTRKTSSATLLTLATLFIIDIFIPTIFSTVINEPFIVETNRLYNPTFAHLRMINTFARGESWWQGGPCALILLIAGNIFLLILHYSLRREMRQARGDSLSGA